MNQHTRLSKLEQHEFSQKWNPDEFTDCIFAVVLPAEKEFQDDWYFITHLIKLSGTLGQPFYKIDLALKWLNAE